MRMAKKKCDKENCTVNVAINFVNFLKDNKSNKKSCVYKHDLKSRSKITT